MKKSQKINLSRYSHFLIFQASFGMIEPPPGVDKWPDMAIIPFIDYLIKIAAIIAGIWSLVNFVMAGYIYISSSGDSGAHQKVIDKMTMTVIGLAIIALSYTIAALLGLILFGDASFIISPKVTPIQ